jgi:hypothetical protein
MKNIKHGFDGFINRKMGLEITKTIQRHTKNKKVMQAFKDEHDIDFVKIVKDLNSNPDTLYFNT